MIVEIHALLAGTLTLNLYTDAEAPDYTAALVRSTQGLGAWRSTFSTLALGLYRVEVLEGSLLVSEGWLLVNNTTGPFYVDPIRIRRPA